MIFSIWKKSWGNINLRFPEPQKIFWNNRGQGIIDYLKEHTEIDEHVILDDNRFDLRIIQSYGRGFWLQMEIEQAAFASDTPAIETMIFRDYIKDMSS